MPHPTATIFWLWFGVMLIGAVVGAWTLNGKSPSPNLSGDRVVFRSPRVFTLFLTTYLLGLPLLGLCALPGQIGSVLAEHDSLIVTAGWSAAFVALFVGVPLLPAVLLFGMLPGPQELRLDKRQQSYSLHFGTFLKRRFQSGSWEDIGGVYVREIRPRGSIISYGIYVAWRPGLSGGPSLGLAGERDQAERLAGKIAQEFGWQVVSRSTI